MNFTTLEEKAAFTSKLIYQECDSQYGNLKKREPTRAQALEALSWLLDRFVDVDAHDKPRQIEAELAVHHSPEHMPPGDDVREGNRNYRFRKEIQAVRALCETSARIVVSALEAAVDLQSRLMPEEATWAATTDRPDDDLAADLVSLMGYVREVIDRWKPTVDKREYNGHMAGAIGRRRARAAHLRWCGRIFAAICSMVWPSEAEEWCNEIRSVFDQDLEQFAVTFVMDGQPTYRRVELNPHQLPGIKKSLVILLKARRLRGNTQKA
ncbi:hypothetical protein GGTG_11566 [Gaeumannomyces tritici R3-111a-1]|uniref:Uncharacterized protein n=1 Tax=Gaeumannomyces tritici (strain R3-111a-1) TaxID=644352 RepID=J3PDJ3_GAET3|nr:hypothetical protein GGTG_11566 [Gaeumannomyces tritici R3-111a-1]EJT70543.1 hypothetical protein GGTG_11566 [Gaeumannomyces tritici R3-111a-1]